MKYETELALRVFAVVSVVLGAVVGMSYGLAWLENNVGLWASLIGFVFSVSLIVSVAVWCMERYT